ESRYAASAYEMTKLGNPFIVTFDFQPDMWATKPPLALWCQAISIKIFGLNEFAVRFPSAMAALFACLAIILFCGKLKRPFVGFYAALILIVSKGIIYYYHVCRSADYEAMLLLWVTVYSLCFFLYCKEKKNRYLLGFFIALSLSVLTKSVQAFIPLPSLFLYAMYKKSVKDILRNRTTYYGLLIFVLLVGTYYFGREIQNHGYLKAVWKEEIGGRYFNVIENHKEPFGFYWQYIYKNYFSYFIWALPVAIVINWCIKIKNENAVTKSLNKDLSIYTFGTAFLYTLIISCSQTKLEWYVIIALPFLALFIALALEKIHFWLKDKTKLKFLPYIFLIAIFFFPYKNAVIKSLSLNRMNHEYNAGYNNRFWIMKRIEMGYLPYGNIAVIINGADGWENRQDSYFYFYRMREAGVNVVYRNIIDDVQIGDTLLVNTQQTMDIIDTTFSYSTLLNEYDQKIVVIENKKNL
ncbi:MAG: glycosyltransferase family 39 protein, partial [Bacteroidales bacterium]|nr:glycosyltransferase family 39 protein [Bacteroidales bacterium]